MEASNISANRITRRNLLINHAVQGDIDTVLSELKQHANVLYDQDIMRIIHEFAVNGHGAVVEPLFKCFRMSTAFNNEAYKAILQLLNEDQDEIAFKLLQIMPRPVKPNGELADVGRFFLRHMIKLKRPVEKLIMICDQMEKYQINRRAYVTLIIACAGEQPLTETLAMLRKFNSHGKEVTEDLFKHLIRNVKSSKEVLMVMRAMTTEFKLPIFSRLISDVVIDRLESNNALLTVKQLVNAEVPTRAAATGVVYHRLRQQDLKTAAEITEHFNLPMMPRAARVTLVAALLGSNDVDNFVKLMASFYDNFARLPLPEDEKDRADALGDITCHAVVGLLRQSKNQSIVELLTKLAEHGLSISKGQAERIRGLLDSAVTEEISGLLDRLSSGELEVVSEQKPMMDVRNLSVDQIEEKLAQTDDAELKKRLQTLLLSIHIRKRDRVKTGEAIQKFIDEKTPIDDHTLANWLLMQIEADDVDAFLATQKKIHEFRPKIEFKSDRLITTGVILLCKNNRIAEARDLLKHRRQQSEVTDPNEKQINPYTLLVNNLLKIDLKVNDFLLIIDSILENGYIKLTDPSRQRFFGKFIMNALNDGSVEKAVELYEQIIAKYKCNAARNELTCHLLKAGDTKHLKRVNEAMGKLQNEHGCAVSTLYSCIDCGEIGYARKLLQTTKLSRFDIKNMRSGYAQKNRAECLERLLTLTQGMDQVDHSEIWLDLLNCYTKDDTSKRALDLWERMQENKEAPSARFLITLAKFLSKLGEPVPFVVPQTARGKVQ